MSKKSVAVAIAATAVAVGVAGGFVSGIIPTAARWLKFAIKHDVEPYIPAAHVDPDTPPEDDSGTPPTP